MAENATELPVSERQDMGLLGVPSGAESTPVVNAAGRPYDPATGRLLPAAPADEPVHAEQPSVTTQAKHSRDLYDAAAYFGISEAEADTIETPTLRKMLRTMTQEQERARDAQERARFWESQRGEKPGQQPIQPGARRTCSSTWATRLTLPRPRRHTPCSSRLAEKERLLDQKLSKLEEREGGRTQQAHFDAWDDAFAAIGDPRLGEGAREEMTPGSPELDLRQKLIQAAGIDMAKQTPAQTKRLLVKAYKAFYPEGAPAKAKPKPAEAAAASYGGEPSPEPRPAGKPPITSEQWNRGGWSPDPPGSRATSRGPREGNRGSRCQVGIAGAAIRPRSRNQIDAAA